jgi:hypothetical protein
MGFAMYIMRYCFKKIITKILISFEIWIFLSNKNNCTLRRGTNFSSLAGCPQGGVVVISVIQCSQESLFDICQQFQAQKGRE